ncbi:MAG: hypothetical protein JWQ87_3041 [Candidatus Sulfotelmatobacter sp.]|nr:hypothetical protein [Candidatus Sulfotelmatobacter sp.]
MCDAYRDLFPKGSIHPENGDTEDVIKRLRAAELDAALVTLPVLPDGYCIQPVMHEPLVVCIRKEEPFAFGGVWDAWKDPATEDWLQSFSIITTAPNELTATVHDRMPVILKPSDYDRWLNRTDAERPPVDLLRPYEAAEMTAHEVDPRVGNVRNDEPSLCNIWQCPPNST